MGPAVLSGATDAAVAGGAGLVARGRLFERLGGAGRVTVVSAPAGSGKTVLLRSWVGAAGLAGRAAWVPVRPGERDPWRFWVSVADALRDTAAGAELVRPLAAAPGLDGWAVLGRLLEDLGPLPERVWLVIDDVHELASGEMLAQLGLFLLRAPPGLRFVLATRRDVRLGLHRLRLEGELTEVRAGDLRFSVEEARALFEGAGAEVPDAALALLAERTEGWAAGLRLAALSLAGHPDPERFAGQFCGSERTVAEYLLAEVLERQSEPVRRLLVRTSVLERVNGELADLLAGGGGGERVLQELEAAGAFVMALDAGRSWFRYHRLFADLLQLELRHTAPGEVPALHDAAAGWFAEHGFPVEAVRHAQAARDWDLAARLLSGHWPGLYLDGQAAAAHELLTGFPADLAADPELAALRAADELDRGSLKEAERYMALAGHASASVPAGRRGRFEVMLAVLRLFLARQRGDLPAVTEEAWRLLSPAAAAESGQLGLVADLRALALISLGIAEMWAARPEDAEQHLGQGAALARRTGQAYLEINGLAHLALVTHFRSFPLSAEQSRQVIELAERRGWAEEPAVAVAYLALGTAMFWQGHLDEAEPWLRRAEHTLQAEAEPAAGILLRLVRGALELALGGDAEALAACQAATPLARLLATPYPLATQIRARMLQALVRLGDTVRADAVLAGLEARDRDAPEMRIALASLRLAQDNPQGATAALAPVLSGSRGSPGYASRGDAIACGGLGDTAAAHGWLVQAWLVEAIARDALGDTAAAEDAVERALGLAESGGVLVPFLLHPAPGLLKRHARYRTTYAALISQSLNLLAQGPGPGGYGGTSRPPVPGGPFPREITQRLSEAEIRVLRYLPSTLSVQEIAGQLSLSINTVRTHMRHIYDKLQAHCRPEAVERARSLCLLSPR